MKRFGSAAWSGSLREGKGSVSTESHAMDSYPYTFFSRYGEKPGTKNLEYFTQPVWLDKSNASGANCFALPKK